MRLQLASTIRVELSVESSRLRASDGLAVRCETCENEETAT